MRNRLDENTFRRRNSFVAFNNNNNTNKKFEQSIDIIQCLCCDVGLHAPNIATEVFMISKSSKT